MFRAEIAPDEAEDAGGLDARQGRQRSMAQFLPKQIKGFYGSLVLQMGEAHLPVFAPFSLVSGGVVPAVSGCSGGRCGQRCGPTAKLPRQTGAGAIFGFNYCSFRTRY